MFIGDQNAAKKFQKLYAKAGNYKIEPNRTKFSFNIVKYHKILLNATKFHLILENTKRLALQTIKILLNSC
jgi:hypothetical protein